MAIIAGQVQTLPYQYGDSSQMIQSAQNLAMTGSQGIADLTGQVKDYFKQQGEKKKLVKQSSLQIDAALQLFPDLAPSLQSVKERMRDENIPLSDRAAEAEVVANLINMGVGEMRNRSNMSFRQDQAMADAIYKQQQLGMQAANLEVAQQRANIYGQKAQAEASKLTKGTLSFFDPDTNQSEEMDVNYDPQGRPRVIGTGELIVDPVKLKYGEGGVEKLPETSQVGGISDSIAQTAKINIGRLSTAKTPGTQGGNLGCADAICRTYEQATGEELVKGGTLSTSEMVGKLANDPRFQSVSVNQAQPGDIIVTPRGKKAGHTGIVLEGGAIASNSSKGFKGGSPGTFVQNYTINSWMNSVAPRNPGKTQVFRRIEEAASPQMAGTPEQQAEVARQIEQGAGMQMVQAGGGMPTEPSLAQQQPQLPARRQVVATRPVSGGAAQGTIMSAEQVKNLTDRGFKVDAIPTNDGNFTVSGVTTGGQTPRYTKTPQEELETRRLTNLDQLQSDVRATGVSAAQDIAPFKEIVGLLDASVKTGFGRQTLMTAKKILGADVSNEEQFQARVGELAMRNIALTKGAISDREMDYFKTVLSPNMGKTTEGNKKIIEFKLKYAERADTIAKIISKMQSQNADPYVIQSEIDKIIESTPLVTVGSTPTSPSSQAESDALFIQGFRSGE
jgi:hypothetical protein